MSRRTDIHRAFLAIEGVGSVYFQPPSNVQMKYPCIRYTLANDQARYADNELYNVRNRYTVIVIDKSPESKIAEAVRKLPYCTFDRTYVAENLNHYVFTIY